jgi:hypothetical protein
MTSHLVGLSFDAHDPARLAQFWADVLRRELAADGVTLLPNEAGGFELRFRQTEATKTYPNQMHFDLTSKSLEDQQQIVARALELGGRHHDVGQGPDEPHIVLADPEGNEFCVIEPTNNFLANTGAIGALSSDGSQAVGYFWSEALGWPLVWDQDEETAIQSSSGGSKISWGGPPVREKTAKNRLRLDLSADGDQQAEVDRLISLGAKRSGDTAGDTAGETSWIDLVDPDGNEFSLQK